MLSFKNLCLGELEFVGQVANGQAMSKKSIWEKGKGRWGSPEGTGEKTIHSLSLNSQEEEVSTGQLPTSLPHTQHQDSCL